MTLDEVIKIIKEKMACDYNISGCDTCNISSCEDRDIVIQLAEWLEELKSIKSDGFTDNLLNMGFTKGYNKAIDDLSEKLCCAFSENSTKGECEGFTCDILTLDSVSDLVISVSEQLRQQN